VETLLQQVATLQITPPLPKTTKISLCPVGGGGEEEEEERGSEGSYIGEP